MGMLDGIECEKMHAAANASENFYDDRMDGTKRALDIQGTLTVIDANGETFFLEVHDGGGLVVRGAKSLAVEPLVANSVRIRRRS